jgi:glycosyltransferase involved in cell wall biosynthesis
LKILLLNYSDSGGGAAIAVERLLHILCQNNVNTLLGVIEKKTADPAIIPLIKKSYFDRFNAYRTIKEIYKKSLPYLRQILKNKIRSSNPILHSENKNTLIDLNYINNSDFDLVHLHWINNDMISIEDLAKIKKPIVWTMHDTWVYCGAEHYPNILENDTRFIEGYKKANKPKTTLGSDICRRTWLRKKKSWKGIKFNFIAPSNYEKDSFDKSVLFQDSSSTCTVIPNIVPKDIFRPLDKDKLRELFSIPLDKKVIGFGAAYDITNKKSIKGDYLLIEALKRIQDKTQYHLVIFGNISISFANEIKIPTFAAGFITNPCILAGIYNLCDVFVCPSLLENLPNVCLEPLSCGIPVTAFNTGGISDIVEHKKTGFLANCFDTEDLFNGIQYCIENYDVLSENSIKKAHTDFDEKIILSKHIELYEAVIKDNRIFHYQ